MAAIASGMRPWRPGEDSLEPTPDFAFAAASLMRGYVLRRLLALLPTLVLASIIVFVTIRLIQIGRAHV